MPYSPPCKSRLLILSSINSLWIDSSPVLFIGQWCKNYKDKSVWEKLDYVVADYHWDDRLKLYSDYKMALQIFENILPLLASSLNQYHNTNYPNRYWRLILGPWLGQYITVILDRWECIHTTFANYNIHGVCSPASFPHQLPPLDTREFLLQLESEEWNHSLFIDIIKYSIKGVPFVGKCKHYHSQNQAKKSLISIARSFLINLFARLLYPLVRNNKYFFIDFPLGKKQILLDLALSQLTCLSLPYDNHSSIPFSVRHDNILFGLCSSRVTDPFLLFVLQQVCKNIPASFLECFLSTRKAALNMPWPSNPRVILSTNSHSTHEFFKIWAAEQITKSNSKLVLLQHGGLYGSAKFHFYEYHEISVSDFYITWGEWGYSHKKCIPLPSQKIARHYLNLKGNPTGGLMLITGSFHKQGYIFESAPIGPQVLEYFDDMFQFTDNLDDHIYQRLQVHLYPFNDHEWKQKDRWQCHFQDISFTSRKKTMYDSIRDQRLVVTTYNSTTLLELLAADIPTILFWNPSHSELRLNAEKYYLDLIKCGILHYNPVSAARFVCAIWNDVTSWWFSASVVKSKKVFCDQYALTSPDSIRMYAETLQSL